MKRLENFKSGFINENPIFGLYLGLCSALAISTSLNNAIGMGVAVTVVLCVSNVIISCIRKITPDEIRIPVYIVVIATLVKIVQMLVQAYTPELNTALGIFLPLIVVNCIILGRAEAFASKNGIFDSLIDGLGMGLGYTVGLLALSVIRQILATGMLTFTNPFNPNIVFFETTFFPSEYTISMFSQPIGAFFTFACLAAALTAFKNSENKKSWKIGAGAVLLVLIGFIGLRSNFMIDNTPEPPAPAPAKKMVDMSHTSIASFEATIDNTADNEDGSVTYTVSCDGYASYDGGAANQFAVTIKDHAVVSVEVLVINDSENIGTRVDDAKFLDQFVGLTLDGLEVEAVSGATISSASTLKAVNTALEAANQ